MARRRFPVDLRIQVKPTCTVLKRRAAEGTGPPTQPAILADPPIVQRAGQAGQPRQSAATGPGTQSTSAASLRPRRRRPRPAPARGRAPSTRCLAKASESSCAVDAERRRTCRLGAGHRHPRHGAAGRRPAGRGNRAAAPPARARSVGRRQRGEAAALHEHRRARGVELDQLADRVEMAARQHHPAQPPAGHQEALRKAVHHHQAVVGVGDVEEAGRGGTVAEPDAFVHLVGDDPGAGAAAVLEDAPAARRASASTRSGCWARSAAARVVAAVTASRSAVEVERPAPAVRLQRNAHAAARPGSAPARVRFGHSGTTATTSSPASTSNCIASIKRVHARRGDGDALVVDRRRAGAACSRASACAQLGQAEVVRIEGLAAQQRLGGGLAHRLPASPRRSRRTRRRARRRARARRWRPRGSSKQATRRWRGAWQGSWWTTGAGDAWAPTVGT